MAVAASSRDCVTIKVTASPDSHASPKCWNTYSAVGGRSAAAMTRIQIGWDFQSG
jgi:hypothetical protein